MLQQQLQDLLSRAPFVRQFGFQLQSAEPGKCTVRFPCNENFLRSNGIVSGPVLMAAADVAMWGAIVSSLGQCAIAAVTAEMKTNFLSAAKREDFWCTATVLKLGARLVFGTAESVAKDQRLLAHHTLTYILPVQQQRK